MFPSALFLSALVATTISVVYGPTLRQIAEITWRDDAYSHGLVLPFVTAYLLYDRRKRIIEALRSCRLQGRRLLPGGVLGGILLGFSVFTFLVAESCGSGFLRWFSLFPALGGIVLLITGTQPAREILPPVFLLFLAKPVPDSIVPRLSSPFQNLAARVSARVLEFVDVPVYVSGNIFEIPGLSLQVEEACSGMRSLMALLCVSCIVCLLFRLPRLAQLFVVGLSVVVALVLNVVRVALAGVLAHFVSPKTAVGFFHSFSGLIVFLIGLGTVYSVTAFLIRLFNRKAQAPTEQAERSPGLIPSPPMLSPVGAVVALTLLIVPLLGFRVFHERLDGTPNVFDVPLETLPLTIGSWRGRDVEGLGVRPLDILKLSRYIRRIYSDPSGNEVLVYVGYWAKQSGEHQAAKHSPTICLPANGWHITEVKREEIRTDHGEVLQVNRVVGGIGARRMLFHYWFFSGASTYAEEWQALARISFQKFFEGRSDGGIVELMTEVKDIPHREKSTNEANEVLHRFAAEFVPALSTLLSPTASGSVEP